MQTKTLSLIETITNITVGYFIAVGIQVAVFPLFGIYVDLDDNFKISIFFAVAAIIRGYVLRRIFTRRRV